MRFLLAALVLYTIAWVAVVASAVILGGRWERRAATGFLMGAVATQLAVRPGHTWARPEFGVAAVDMALLIYLLWVARGSARWWPIWAAAAQGAAVLSHLSAALVPAYPRELYLTLQPFWAFPLLATIAIGVRAQMRSGSLESWRRSPKQPDPARSD